MNVTEGINMTSSNLTTPNMIPRGDPNLPMFRYICDVILTLPIALFGIIGNMLAFVVLCRQKQKLTTTVLLQALAFTDTILLILAILLRSMRYLSLDAYQRIYHYMFLSLFPCVYIFRMADTWLTVLLTIDRFIAVCYPLHAQRLCTMKRTYITMFLLLIASLAVCIPRFFEYEYAKHHFMTSPLGLQAGYVFGYQVAMFFLMMYLVPMTLLIVLNTRLVRTLRRAHDYREMAFQHSIVHNSKTPALELSHKISRSITAIVVAVVLICTVCNLLAMTVHIIYSINKVYHNTTVEVARRYLANISNLMLTFNCAVNFVIYCLCSRNFRVGFLNTFHCTFNSATFQDNSGKRTTTESLSGSTGMRLSTRNTKKR